MSLAPRVVPYTSTDTDGRDACCRPGMTIPVQALCVPRRQTTLFSLQQVKKGGRTTPKIYGTPTWFLVDRNGVIRKVIVGREIITGGWGDGLKGELGKVLAEG